MYGQDVNVFGQRLGIEVDFSGWLPLYLGSSVAYGELGRSPSYSWKTREQAFHW